MLLVPTFIGPSTVNGIGLFAKSNIARGSLVWRQTAASLFIIDRSVAAEFPEVAQAFLRTYATLRPNGWNLAWDNARFINHSDPPNLIYDYSGSLIAGQRISAGEELTENYRALGEIEPLPEGDPECFGSMT